MYLFKFLTKVKKSKHDQELVYVIASCITSAGKRISGFTEGKITYLSSKKLSSAWDGYDEN